MMNSHVMPGPSHGLQIFLLDDSNETETPQKFKD